MNININNLEFLFLILKILQESGVVTITDVTMETRPCEMQRHEIAYSVDLDMVDSPVYFSPSGNRFNRLKMWCAD